MTEAPYAVVGAGVVGLATAYYLRRAGLDVVVVEGRHAGAGASHGNAGWVVPSMSAPLPGPGMLRTAAAALRDRDGALFIPPRQLLRLLPWGLRFAAACSRSAAESGLHATSRLAAGSIELYDELSDDGVAFDMTANGLLEVFDSVPAAGRAAAALEPLFAYGYAVPAILGETALHALEPALGAAARAGILIEGERAVHPGSLVNGLRDRLAQLDVPVHEQWSVQRLAGSGGAVRSLHGPRGELAVSGVVIAAGAWSAQLLTQLGCRVSLQGGKGYSLSIAPGVMPTRPLYASQVKVAATPLGARVRLAGTMEMAGLDNTLDRNRIEAMKRAIGPYLAPWDPTTEADSWCGLRPMTPDGLPLLGRVPDVDNAYVATGHAMLGVTLAPASGRAVADLVVGKGDDQLLEPFRPSRPGARGMGQRAGAGNVTR